MNVEKMQSAHYEKYLVRVEEKLFDDVPREARVGHVDFRPLVGDDVGRW